MEFKKSLQTDIQVGLLQSPLIMGDTKGTIYAAGHVAEVDRLAVLEGLQKIIRNIANDAINKRLALTNKTQDSVWSSSKIFPGPRLRPATSRKCTTPE
ncbi:hypothetical protein MSMTP_1644 [Methanosarcina sp. MTP4]|uniref:hypothetical protein n=1 Tax=Methanosarcina sp. MTP4 TaxID=1434100 RepID=UPI000615BAD1|nr:hypothetical protein [Methanosarcina sp. MTP4]AKB25113.1 hypothetical protein MSMTP_1644 [Methanosarcina sp. MTP4]